MKSLMTELVLSKELSQRDAHTLMTGILNDELSAEQIGFILACFEIRTPTGKELAGFVEALLERSQTLDPIADTMIDVCGTGGDGLGMFNVSTCVAFVVAGGGVKVAKHGNRAVSSRCGSFDVLEALSVPFARSPREAKECLDEKGLAFLYAPSFHPILGKLSFVRRNIGIRTIFNALGPLLNPARVKRQLIGVYSSKLLGPMAEALKLLGTTEALIVHGEDGSDEITLTRKTQVAHLKGGNIFYDSINPADFGLEVTQMNTLLGGEVTENAAILQSVLKGERSPYREMTLANAGAAFMIAGKAGSLKEGIEIAKVSIDTGAALAALRCQQMLVTV